MNQKVCLGELGGDRLEAVAVDLACAEAGGVRYHRMCQVVNLSFRGCRATWHCPLALPEYNRARHTMHLQAETLVKQMQLSYIYIEPSITQVELGQPASKKRNTTSIVVRTL